MADEIEKIFVRPPKDTGAWIECTDLEMIPHLLKAGWEVIKETTTLTDLSIDGY